MIERHQIVCGCLDKFRLAFYHLHDTPKIHIKFDNRSSNFGDCAVKIEIDDRQQANGNRRPLFPYSRDREKWRKPESSRLRPLLQ